MEHTTENYMTLPLAPAPWLPPACLRDVRLVLHVGQHPDHEGQ
jgi:hypothetical protein